MKPFQLSDATSKTGSALHVRVQYRTTTGLTWPVSAFLPRLSETDFGARVDIEVHRKWLQNTAIINNIYTSNHHLCVVSGESRHDREASCVTEIPLLSRPVDMLRATFPSPRRHVEPSTFHVLKRNLHAAVILYCYTAGSVVRIRCFSLIQRLKIKCSNLLKLTAYLFGLEKQIIRTIYFTFFIIYHVFYNHYFFEV